MEDEFFEIEGSRGWQSLFQKLHQISRAQAGTQNDAKKPANMPRNRYRDVLPIDETRVKLLSEDNDYINANLVKVDEVQRSYLLTQGPLQHTCAHFWQMVWEQKTAGILMLNKCVERGMNKCYQYFPTGGEEGKDTLEFGDYQIELEMYEEGSSYKLSHLSLTNTEEAESRTVLHFQYTQWPDFGVPKTADIFLNFLYDVRKSGVLQPNVGPCVVHCSAGIGRSGTFCLVDVCLKKIEDTNDGNSVKIREVLLEMRKQRLGLIQTPDQLRFSYIAILQGARYFLGYESESESETESEDEDEDDIPLHPNPAAKLDIHVYNEQTSDLPPPIPPRPPDLVNHQDQNNKQDFEDEDTESSGSGSSPPPPPPTSLPPPSSVQTPAQTHPRSPGVSPSLPTKRPRVDEAEEDEIEEVLVSYQKRESETISESDEGISEEEEEEVEEIQTWTANVSEAGKQTTEEETGDMSPPVPPRVQSVRQSVSPFANVNSLSSSNTADHFLGAGRGGEVTSNSPPALPAPDWKVSRGPEPSEPLSERNFDEQALIDELHELEKLVSSAPEQKVAEESEAEKRTQLVLESAPDEQTQQVPESAPDEQTQQVPISAPDEQTQQIPVSVPDEQTQQVPVSVPDEQTQQVPVSVPDEQTQQVPVSVPDEQTQQVPVSVPDEQTQQVPSTTKDPGLRQRETTSSRMREASERRKRERDERHRRLQEKVEAIHAKQQQSEDRNKWMVPFMVGLAVVVGVGIWYYFNK